MKALLDLPPDVAARASPNVTHWVAIPHAAPFIFQDFATLVNSLGDAGQLTEALQIARGMLAFLVPTSHPSRSASPGPDRGAPLGNLDTWHMIASSRLSRNSSPAYRDRFYATSRRHPRQRSVSEFEAEGLEQHRDMSSSGIERLSPRARSPSTSTSSRWYPCFATLLWLLLPLLRSASERWSPFSESIRAGPHPSSPSRCPHMPITTHRLLESFSSTATSFSRRVPSRVLRLLQAAFSMLDVGIGTGFSLGYPTDRETALTRERARFGSAPAGPDQRRSP